MRENYQTPQSWLSRLLHPPGAFQDASPGYQETLLTARAVSKSPQQASKSLFLSTFTGLLLTMLFTISTTNAQCVAPTIVGTSNITENTATLNWIIVTGNTYTIELYTNPTYTSLVNTYTGISNETYTLSALVPGTIYYYRIKVDNAGTCTNYGTGSFTATSTYTPIDLTGFTEDVIANGVGSGASSTSAAVDSGNYAYLSSDFRLTSTSTAPTQSLPVNRNLTSSSVTGLYYILRPYRLSNSLRLAGVTNGTLTLTKPSRYKELYCAVAAGSSATTGTITVNFSDGTSQTTSAINYLDWFSNATTDQPAIVSSIGRVSRTTSSNPETGASKIFQVRVSIDAENQGKYVSSLRFNKTADAGFLNIFAVSGLYTGDCPSMYTLSATASSYTSATANWTSDLGSTNDAVYSVYAYSDAAYANPIAGYPVTEITGNSYTLTGLPSNATTYIRVKATNGICESGYVNTSVALAYCTPTTTNTSATYNITNFTTTLGATNINNSTAASPATVYANFTAQTITKFAGTSFNFNGTKVNTSSKLTLFVDWNRDYDFDDAGETVATIASSGGTTYSGSIAIPAGTANGNYRLRVRSASNVTIGGCGSLLYGETEDYTLAVITAPAACATPTAPTATTSGVALTTATVNITAATAPTGYLIVRSTSATLGAAPVNNTIYTVGGTIGNGTILANSTATTYSDSGLSDTTTYYYFVYAYNYDATFATCAGPVYSAAGTTSALTCTVAPTIAPASNITSASASVNWSSKAGATYTVEVYTDNTYANPFITATAVSGGSYTVSGLTDNTPYYFRVKVDNNPCASPYGTGSFTAQKGYTPLTVTGFSIDAIANGIGNASVSSTGPVDTTTSNQAYLSRDFQATAASTLPTVGLPVNRTLTSPNVTGLQYMMANYTGNNSLRLEGNTNGTLTLSTALPLQRLYFGVTSGNGNSAFSAQVFFTDGTSQTVTGLAASNWDAGTPAAGNVSVIGSLGRVNRGDNGINTGNFQIFQATLNIDAANQSKLVQSVRITNTTSGANASNYILNVFAISGKITPDCNAPGSLTVSDLTSSTAKLNWTALNPAPANGYEYYYSTTNTAPSATATVNASNVVTTNSANISSLTPGSTYYWWARSICSAELSSSWEPGSSFVPFCTTPNAVTAFNANITSTTAALSWTAPTTAPTGYVVFRSTSATAPTVDNGTSYAANTTYNTNYLCVYNGTAATANATGLAESTLYYFYAFAYNSTGCPVAYSTVTSTSATTCLAAPLIVGASNVKNNQANLTWTRVPAIAGGTVTYNFEVYTDAGYSTLLSSQSGLTGLRTTLTSLAANATYYWRVQAVQGGNCSSSWATSNFIAQNTYTPIDVNGYTHDVIANGTGIARTSAGASVDAASNAYLSLDYKQNAGSAAATYGLPLNRNLTGSISGLKFFLEDYAQNNAIRIAAQNTSATINLSVPLKLTDMYIAVTGGSGTATVTADIVFDDASHQVTPSLTFQDWYQTNANTPSLITNIGRVNMQDNTGAPEPGNSKIFQVTIPILAANQSKKITGVTFTKTSDGEPVANIFAISGRVIGDCPTMNATTAVSNSYSTGTVSWTLSSPGEGYTAANVSYRVEVYTNANFTGAVTGSPFTTAAGASTYTVTGLSATTTYYYKVTGVNSSCESGFVSGSFTTPVSCFATGGVTIPSVSTNGATVSWTAPTATPETGYEYYYSTSSTAPTAATTVSGSVNASTTTATLASLTPNTVYYVWVRSACTGTDRSAWSSSATFTTSCVAVPIPLTEGFNTANTGLPNCWAQQYVVGTSALTTQTSSSNPATTPYEGSRYVYFSSFTSATPSGNETRLVSAPVITTGTSNVDVEFYWMHDNGYTTYLQEGVQVQYSLDGTNWVNAGNFIQRYDANLSGWNKKTITLPAAAGNQALLYVGFKFHSQYGNNCSLDTVTILASPSCVAPAGLSADTTLTSATISWTASVTTSPEYEYYVSASSTAPTAATTPTGTVSTTSVTLNNLTTNATYYYWVRSKCSDADKSTWASGRSFYTSYCTPTYAQTCDTGHRISVISVTQTGFNTTMTTGCTHDYTATQIPVTAGSTYTFNITSTGWIGVGIAADINGNGNFNDTGDIIALTNWINADVANYTANITIPANTASGLYRIRFWQREGNGGPGNSPCGSYDWGTWVDYTLNVTAPCFNWVGTDSSWTNTANWCGGVVPTATSDVVIPATSHNPVISTGTALAHNLTVGAGATLTVATGATLSVDNILSVNPAATLTIANNGALLQGAATATNDNAGKITIHKSSNPLFRLDYTMWSSPVAGQNLLNFSPETAATRFYEYKYAQNTSNAWVEGYWSVTPGDHSFEAAKGYLIRMPNADALTGFNDGTASFAFDGTFTGIPNNGNVSIALSTANNRFTAVGNPYPSPISVADFFTANSSKLHTTTGLYLWRKRNSASSSSYATLTQAGYTANPGDATTVAQGNFYPGTNATTGNWLISQGQGFIVKTATGQTNPQLNFTNSMRRAAPGATQGFFRTAQNTASKLWLNMKAQNGTASQALIAYMEEGTLGLDYGYDGLKLTDANTVAFYSIAENAQLAIQARPEFDAADIVPMGYTVPTAGEFTVGLDHTEGVFEQGQVIYLKDNAEGIIRNISDRDYTFISEAGTFENRFEIVYRTSALGTDNPTVDPDTVIVYKQGNTINISTGSTLINGVTIFDIRGRQLYTANGINDTKAAVSNLNIAQQVIIVEVNTVKGKVSKRIVY